MKNYIYILILIISFPVLGYNQGTALAVKNPTVVTVSYNKRITLIFPNSITEKVAGNDSIKLEVNNNRLHITALYPAGFNETSLYVELETGFFYDLVLRFNNNIKNAVTVFTKGESNGFNDPKILKNEIASIDDSKVATLSYSPSFSNPSYKSYEIAFPNIAEMANHVMDKGTNVIGKAEVSKNLQFFLENIYAGEGKHFLKISCYNESTKLYFIDSIVFKIQDKINAFKKEKSAQRDLHPVYILNDEAKEIGRKMKVSKVFVFENIVIDDNAQMIVELYGNHEDKKNLSFKLGPEDFQKAGIVNK